MAPTHFLNVDLDPYSRRDLQPLVKSLGANVIVMYAGLEGKRYSAHLEVAGRTRTADSTIRTFCRMIEGLPAPARALWDAASTRSFSIGIQAGTRPSPRDFRLRLQTLEAAAAVDAEIVLTIYPCGFRR